LRDFHNVEQYATNSMAVIEFIDIEEISKCDARAASRPRLR
jgi:hypothetical protein